MRDYYAEMVAFNRDRRFDEGSKVEREGFAELRKLPWLTQTVIKWNDPSFPPPGPLRDRYQGDLWNFGKQRTGKTEEARKQLSEQLKQAIQCALDSGAVDKRQLAYRMGYEPATITRILKGAYPTTDWQIRAIAALNLEVQLLFPSATE